MILDITWKSSIWNGLIREFSIGPISSILLLGGRCRRYLEMSTNMGLRNEFTGSIGLCKGWVCRIEKINALRHPKALELKFEYHAKKHSKIDVSPSKRISNHLSPDIVGITSVLPQCGVVLDRVMKWNHRLNGLSMVAWSVWNGEWMPPSLRLSYLLRENPLPWRMRNLSIAQLTVD